MIRKPIALFALALSLLSAALPAGSQTRPTASPSLVSLLLIPSVAVPLGESSSLFRLSGGAELAAEMRLPFLPALSLDAGLGYTFYPMRGATAAKQSLSMFSASAGLGLQFKVAPRLALKGFAGGGYSYGFSNDFAQFRQGGGAFIEAGTRLLLDVSSSLSLGAGASYRNSFGLFQGLGISLGAWLRLPARAGAAPAQPAPSSRPELLEQVQGPGIELRELAFSDIFPVFHKYYDDHAVGTAVLYNAGSTECTDIKLTLDIKPYMSTPRTCVTPAVLGPGESAQVDLTALFSEQEILEVTEGTKASAVLAWEYTMGGSKRSESMVETVRLLNRNAMTWADDRRAAAFITALDPAVLTFQKNVLAIVKSTAASALDANLLTAIAFYEALCQYGLGYTVDPTSSRTQATANRSDVDFLQFPRQTLEYKGGDCDDLTILFCALFESANIATAFITVPGHIFMAIALRMPPEQAAATFQPADDLIFLEDCAWLPIEVTRLDGKFIEAWQAGAKEWREAGRSEQAGFYPTRDAWAIYEPVGLASGTFLVVMPPKEAILGAYQREMERFVSQQIYSEVTRLQAEIQKTQRAPKAVNTLGVLYAKYGLTDLAEKQFLEASRSEYGPALMNLGNIAYLRDDLNKAQAYYERAVRKSPEDPKALICLARVYHAGENYGLVKDLYAKVRELDPALAEQFAYLELREQQSTRAGDVSAAGGPMVWAEE